MTSTASLISALGSQRAALERVAAGVAAQSAALPSASDGAWRSDAQRAYARDLADLEALLRTARNALQHAVAAIDSDIAAAAVAADTAGMARTAGMAATAGRD